jgi:hypothetical protein
MLPTLIKPDELEAFLRGLTTPPGFDARGYLMKNPDIFVARADPYTHYRAYGRGEGRRW